jgi:8-oxo-dGTP diphosphatase
VGRPRRRGGAIAVWHAGRVLIVRNSYRAGSGLPAGGQRRRETPRQAAVRELREEVGVRIAPEQMRFVGEVASRFEFKHDLCSVFELDFEAPPRVRVDRREVVWAGFAAPAEVLAAATTPVTRAYLSDGRAGPGAAPIPSGVDFS